MLFRLWTCLPALSLFVLLAADDPLFIPHIPKPDSAFAGELLLENRFNETSSATLVYYDADGNRLDERNYRLAPGELLVRNSADFHEQGETAYVTVTTENPLEVGITYSNAGQPTAFAYQPALARPARIWRFTQADWGQLFDGLVFVNPECGGIQLMVTQTNRDGSPLTSEPLLIEETESKKLVLQLSSYLSNLPGTVITIESSDLLYAVGLRGDLAGGTRFLSTGHPRVRDEWAQDRAELQKNRARWLASGITDSYTYVVDAACLCSEAGLLPARVAVRYGQIVSAVHPDTNEALHPSVYSRLPTVNDLFDRAATALVGTYTDILIEYDPTLGYPTLLGLNPKRCVIDDETNFTIQSLEGLR